LGPTFGAIHRTPSDEVEGEESCKAPGSIELCPTKALEGIDDDLVGCCTSVEASDTHESWNLASSDADGRTSHETADGGGGDELDDPAEAEETDTEDDEARDDGETASDSRVVPLVWMGRMYVLDDVGDGDGHDCDWADGDILRGCKKAVDEDTDERRVKTIFGRQTCELDSDELGVQGSMIDIPMHRTFPGARRPYRQ